MSTRVYALGDDYLAAQKWYRPPNGMDFNDKNTTLLVGPIRSNRWTFMVFKNSQLSAISRLFSSAVFREMALKGRSGLFSRLFKESQLTEQFSMTHVRDAFEAAFGVLKAGSYRDEYTYKAALTHKVLLGTHSLSTACMLNEFRVGECKADLAILNGTATVYEIKSERDSLSRLEKQVEAYKKVFARVFVIAGENHIDSVLAATSKDIGVMKLSRRHQISVVRSADDRPDRICPITVFESLRTSEAKQILTQLGVSVPKLPNTVLHSELRKRFIKLSPSDLHFEMVKTLKRTRNLLPLSDLVESLPSSLQPAALSVSVKKDHHKRLVSAVNTRLREAVQWV